MVPTFVGTTEVNEKQRPPRLKPDPTDKQTVQQTGVHRAVAILVPKRKKTKMNEAAELLFQFSG